MQQKSQIGRQLEGLPLGFQRPFNLNNKKNIEPQRRNSKESSKELKRRKEREVTVRNIRYEVSSYFSRGFSSIYWRSWRSIQALALGDRRIKVLVENRKLGLAASLKFLRLNRRDELSHSINQMVSIDPTILPNCVPSWILTGQICNNLCSHWFHLHNTNINEN